MVELMMSHGNPLVLTGWIGMTLTIGFMVTALVIYTKNYRFPRWFKLGLWTIPAMPFLAFACLVLIIVGASDRG